MRPLLKLWNLLDYIPYPIQVLIALAAFIYLCMNGPRWFGRAW